MLKEPAAEHPLNMVFRQWQVIRVSETDVDAYTRVMIDQFRRVINGQDYRGGLSREPAAPRSQVNNRAPARKAGLVEKCPKYIFKLAHQSATGPENVMS